MGKCRAWIRCTLNDGVFRSYLISAVKYRRYIIKFYNKTAIIRDHKCFEKIIALTEGIDGYYFDLTLNSSLLNTWPNSTLMLAGYWTPALKNNPLYNNSPQIAEAVDASDTDETVLINEKYKSEESYTSSLSSSFVDSELLRKPPTILDEDIGWNLIMNQPSTSYINYNINKDISPKEATKEISSSEIATIETCETKIVKEECTTESLATDQNTESITIKEVENEVQSFNELIESYNLRMKNLSSCPRVEDLYKQLTVPKIIEEQHFNDSTTIDDVS